MVYRALKINNSNALGTIELSTGLQISGVFTNVIEDEGKPVYVQTTGKTALSYREKELVGTEQNIMLKALVRQLEN